ncbi:MAG: hypothetical protein ACFFD4_31965 [Candidatus Odinarchaeota archaeon]
MDLQQIETKIKEELKEISSIFNDFTGVYAEKVIGLSVLLYQLPVATKDNSYEVKYSWHSLPDVNELYGKFLTSINKLKTLNQYFNDITVIEYLSSLSEFVEQFLEFNQPWMVVDWRCFYQVTEDGLHWLDNRQARLETFPSEGQDWKNLLEPGVNERLRNQYLTGAKRAATRMKAKTSALMSNITFATLIRQLQARTATSFLQSIAIKWQELLDQTSPSNTELALLAYIARAGIEVVVRNSYPGIIDPKSKLSLGLVFGKLQGQGIFAADRPRIEPNLQQLNEAVHGKKLLTKQEVIVIKEEFKAILRKQGLDLPF